jgi:hypothetical protein
MGRVNISNGLDRDIRARLQSDESPLIVASLRIPKHFTAGTSWFAIIVFVRLFDEIHNFFKMRKLSRQFEEIQFPIARRTTVCVTERRILLWKHSAVRKSHGYLGSVDRTRVKASYVARSTHVKWKFITIDLVEGAKLRFLIDHQSAAPLSDQLNANL